MRVRAFVADDARARCGHTYVKVHATIANYVSVPMDFVARGVKY